VKRNQEGGETWEGNQKKSWRELGEKNRESAAKGRRCTWNQPKGMDIKTPSAILRWKGGKRLKKKGDKKILLAARRAALTSKRG